MKYATAFLATMMLAMPACAQPTSAPIAAPPTPPQPPVTLEPNTPLKIASPPASRDGVWYFANSSQSVQSTEKGAYLGAAVSEVPSVLRDQLKLRKNVGLVVDFVEAGSPAEAAGLKKSDIIQMLDDQLIVTGKQFAILVRIHDPSKEVKLSVIRESNPMQLTAKLTERDLAMLDATSSAQFDRLIQNNRIPAAVNVMLDAFGLESSDSEHSLSLSNTNGRKHLVARDKAGKVIFEGDVNTPEQLAKVPDSIRPKVKALLERQRILPTTRPFSMPPAKALPRVSPKEDASRI